MIIIYILLGIIVLGALALSGAMIERVLVTPKHKISFKESLDLTDLAIITFVYGEDKKLNFMLDTGSNMNHIIPSIVKSLKIETDDVEIPVTGIGNTSSNKVCKLSFNYQDREYSDMFCITPSLSKTFKSIKDECGVTIHGIIGNGFFQKYKYVLDFSELAAYEKKR